MIYRKIVNEESSLGLTVIVKLVSPKQSGLIFSITPT